MSALVCALTPAIASSQELEPRAYSASPVGLNFLVEATTWLSGSVLLDADLPISDVQSDVKILTVGVGHTFNPFGDLALVTAALLYAAADVTGNVLDQQGEAKRSGLANPLFKVSVNLKGNPAMSPEGPWEGDAYVGASFFTPNRNFFPVIPREPRTPC